MRTGYSCPVLHLVDRGLDPLKQEKQARSEFVESLVRTHTNLMLEQRLEMYETGLFPWDIEMTVEESVSDDDCIFLYFFIVS